MANVQKCACTHEWGHHEGSGGRCTYREPAAEPSADNPSPQPGPQCECPTWDGQPVDPEPEDDDDEDELDEELDAGDQGGGDDEQP